MNWPEAIFGSITALSTAIIAIVVFSDKKKDKDDDSDDRDNTAGA